VGNKRARDEQVGPRFFFRGPMLHAKSGGAGVQRIEVQDFSLFRAERLGLLEGIWLCDNQLRCCHVERSRDISYCFK